MGQACLFMAFDLCFDYAYLRAYKQSILDLPPWHLKYFDSGITQGFKCLFLLTTLPFYIYIFLCLLCRDGKGNPLQYSCLENPMDGGAWRAAVHGVAKSRTRLDDFTFIFHFHALEKEMATHSSVLAWRIPGWWGLVGFRLWGFTESDMTEVNQQQQHVYYVIINVCFLLQDDDFGREGDK